jgi:CMP/dCMP kinase
MARVRRLVVTIDGPAGAGKSTVAKRVARELGYRLLDTGAIYRAVALQARRDGVDWADEAGCAAVARALDIDFRFSQEDGQNRVLVGGADVSAAIRTPEISDGASRVSAWPEVRGALLELQRRLGAVGGVVVEGRDTGTVVFPSADAKFFLTASPEERARRRVIELRETGRDATEDSVLAEIRARDHRDSSRAAAPLRQAEDARLLDSSGRSIDEVVAEVVADVQARASSTC